VFDNSLRDPYRDSTHIVKAILEMDDRSFTPELSIFATNPRN